MAQTEVYRYFWMRVTNQSGREANSIEEMRFMESLAGRASTAPQKSAQGGALMDVREQVRWFLGPNPDSATRVTIIDAATNLGLQTVVGEDDEISEPGVEIDLLSMPAAWGQSAAAGWIKSPVGRIWSHGAIACKFGYSVVTGAARQEG